MGAWKTRLLTVVRPLLERRVYTARRGLMKGLKRRGGLSFVPRLGPEDREVAFLHGLSLDGATVYDVGGYQGVFALFFARAAGPGGRVIVFEPNPENVARIEENVALNGFSNVDVVPVALGSEPGQTELVFDPMLAGVGSLRPEIGATLSRERTVKRLLVTVDTLDDVVARGDRPPPSFVKIDVEGFELEVLHGMKRTLDAHRPTLFIELHDVYLPDVGKVGAKIVELLIDQGYRIEHVEEQRTLATGDAPEFGHLYCTADAVARTPASP